MARRAFLLGGSGQTGRALIPRLFSSASMFGFDGAFGILLIERPPTPAFGSETAAILASLGFDDAEVARLAHAGAVLISADRSLERGTAL